MRFRFHKLFHRLAVAFPVARKLNFLQYLSRLEYSVSRTLGTHLPVVCGPENPPSGMALRGKFGIFPNPSREAAIYHSPARKRWVKARTPNQPRRAAR